jgi:bifunctional NMN adenylyltransferase/nudix hydrolase
MHNKGENMKADIAIVIGRFAPFHKGHKSLVDKAFSEAHKVIVVLGSATESRSTTNPFTASERQTMIEAVYPDSNISFIHLPDSNYDNPSWCEYLSESVKEVTEESDTIKLLGHFKDHSSFYLNHFPQWELVEAENFEKGLSATEIRSSYFFGEDLWKEQVPKEVYEWLKYFSEYKYSYYNYLKEWFSTNQKKYIKPWAFAPYTPTFQTGDAMVLCNNHILIITRKDHPGKGQLAMPGGFLEPHESIRNCALRELNEEAGIDVPMDVLHDSIVERENFDLPGRDTRGRFITECYVLEIEGYKELPLITAQDDALAVQWMPISQLKNMDGMFYADHLRIIRYFLKEKLAR